MPFEHLHNDYLLNTGNAVWDESGIAQFIKQSAPIVESWLGDVDQMMCTPQFISRFQSWIGESELNRFTGLDSFPHVYAALGATQTLDSYHYWIKTQGLRLRLMPGEYPYNLDISCGFDRDRDWIGADPLATGDAVLISVPFSATGNRPEGLDDLLDQCERLKIPVLIDCAWFGTCGGIDIDLSHPAIVTAAFSTGKALNCGLWRSGVAFTKIEYPALKVQNQWNHSVHFNNRMSLLMLDNFGPDYMYKRYREAQIKTCEVYGLTPSCSVHIGIGDPSWEPFARGGGHYRVNLRRAIRNMFERGRVRQ